ncbi:uncharacterized protein LOC130736914 [Lotus japonicus]|uniref:uncharacterized protein LOC130736914 n=1 Tax=Lotus japonicus TaxID=34305 RepID=UPI00258572BF|nr:uncharacterized protein LOC130736914 [Lotus japonicus]
MLLKEALAKKQGQQEHLIELNKDEEEEDRLQEIVSIKSGKISISSSGASSAAPKKPNVKGPLDLHFMRDPETSLNLTKAKKQTSMIDACNKKARARTIQYIARFFIRNSIPFNVVRSKSFKLMLEVVGNYGPHLRAPSYHEMRVPLLKKELEYTQNLMKQNVVERAKYGCSIMSDAWTDRKQRTLINFLVNSPAGSMFVRSVDGSSYMKTGEKLFTLLDSLVEEIGEKNVVQVVTDNGSNYVLAEEIGKLKRVQKTIKRGISLVDFFYNHTLALNIMRKYTNKSELVRHGVTRFATTFLTLRRLYTQRNNLRKMFTSDDWTKTTLAKVTKGKGAANVVLMNTFWNDVAYCLRSMGPLVHVLRLVDNERKLAMGHIYEAMDRAKEAIKSGFKGNESKYKAIWAIIDKRC